MVKLLSLHPQKGEVAPPEWIHSGRSAGYPPVPNGTFGRGASGSRPDNSQNIVNGEVAQLVRASDS